MQEIEEDLMRMQSDNGGDAEEILRRRDWEVKAALQKSEKDLEVQQDLAAWLAKSWSTVQRELEEAVPGVVYYSEGKRMRERLI